MPCPRNETGPDDVLSPWGVAPPSQSSSGSLRVRATSCRAPESTASLLPLSLHFFPLLDLSLLCLSFSYPWLLSSSLTGSWDGARRGEHGLPGPLLPFLGRPLSLVSWEVPCWTSPTNHSKPLVPGSTGGADTFQVLLFPDSHSSGAALPWAGLVAYLRQRGIRIFPYLGDLLIAASFRPKS